MKDSSESLLTAEQAARELNISPRRMRQLLRDGRVEGARRVGRSWMIPTALTVDPGSRGPAAQRSRGRQWVFNNRRGGFEVKGHLRTRWEVNFDPISDDYTPWEISAGELFALWISKVTGKYPNDLIPIYWSVYCQERRLFESMPFQYSEYHQEMLPETFLTFFTWPVDPKTGEELNWLDLTVDDKLWNSTRGDKGGFIQEATGWKPSILQPYVYLPALMSSVSLATTSP